MTNGKSEISLKIIAYSKCIFINFFLLIQFCSVFLSSYIYTSILLTIYSKRVSFFFSYNFLTLNT
ncbi:unnamed protein product [Phytomonas sp. EM1]|nr:unnamed protein product [Phytomonas sp. EM1]|eukprot:CCW60755.1 unnamed protein product [Phytomonas sp. isolate EM1]